MTSVTFDNETISDAIAKAARVAPRLTSKTGHSAGLVIRIDPGNDEPVMVRASDGQVFWDHWVDTVEVTGEATEWRVLADGLATLVAGLPFGSNKRVTFSDESGARRIDIRRPGLKAWIAMLEADSYLAWEPYDESFTEPVDNFAERLELVSWACSRDDTLVPWSGVMFDGERIIASDAYRFACVPCPIPVSEPVTLPVSKILPQIKHAGTVRLGVKAGKLLICPDGYSQISSAVFARNYPKFDHILRDDYEYRLTLDKSVVGAHVKRAVQMAQKQDSPGMTLLIGGGEISIHVQHPDGTEGYEQSFDVDGADHETVRLRVTPQMFFDVMSSGPDETTVMHYDREENKAQRKPRLYFSGSSGYQAWMPPLQDVRAP